MTKRAILRQSEPEPELSPEQQAALLALLAGETDEAAGVAAGVSRQTVNRWKSEPGFRAALNLAQQQQWSAAIDRLRGTMDRAISVIQASLESDDERIRLQAAWKLLGAVPLAAPTGATTAAGVQHEKVVADLYGSLIV